MTQTLFVDKTNQTFADALVAHGLAQVAKEVTEQTRTRREKVAIELHDDGGVYRITSSVPLTDERLEAVSTFFPEAYIIRTRKNAKRLPDDLPPQITISWEEERDRRAEYFEIRNGLTQEAKQALRRGEDHPALAALRAARPHKHWDIFRAINPEALIGYNKLMTQWWAIREALPEVLKLLRDLFSQTPNDLDAAIEAWRTLNKEHSWGIDYKTSALQIYNPAQGKGQNRTKADGMLRMDNIRDAFWLVEWLKAVGFYPAALTKRLRGTKDRKTYVLAPREIDLTVHEKVMNAFRESMQRAETAIRSDVLLALRYTQTLLRYSEEHQAQRLKHLLMRVSTPARIVSGFHTAFYKNLGNSAATMNISFIGLPDWIHIRNAQDVKGFLAVLEEHENIVRQFDESHSDDFNLLLRYRDFISASDLSPFLEFATAYADYIISQRERSGGRARQFTTTSLEVLFMNSENLAYSEIIQNEGFQDIAYAIRHSTVTPQWQKIRAAQNRGPKPLYDIRYGLGQQLARKSAYPHEFLAELGDFLQKYNAENGQVRELLARRYPGDLPQAIRFLLRRDVRSDAIDQIIHLVDKFDDSRLICNLLIAYGYARPPRSGPQTEESAMLVTDDEQNSPDTDVDSQT